MSESEAGICGICGISGPLPLIEEHFMNKHGMYKKAELLSLRCVDLNSSIICLSTTPIAVSI